jgi:hypothetical protein
MVKHFATLALAALISGSVTLARSPQQTQTSGQAAADIKPSQDRVLGDVIEINASSRRLTVKDASGQSFAVNVDDKTLYRRIPPGETSPDKIAVITLADIAVGDRVLARGKLDANSILARALTVVSRAEITRKEEHDKGEWLRRGISGTVVGLNRETKEIMVRMRTGGGDYVPIRIAAAEKGINFRRYAPGSVRYSDAKASSFEELKPGDQIRALGEKSEDGSSFKPQEIVFGSFRMTGGIITAVNPQTGEITINDIQSKLPFTIAVTRDSMLRRLPPELLAKMEQSMEQSSEPAQEAMAPTQVMTPNGPRIMMRQIVPQGKSTEEAQRGKATPGQPTPTIRRVMVPEGQTPESTNQDYQEIIEKLPSINIADLKPGEGIIVSSTSGTDPSRAIAITLAAGVESFLKRQSEAKSTRPGYQLDLSLPGLGAP